MGSNQNMIMGCLIAALSTTALLAAERPDLTTPGQARTPHSIEEIIERIGPRVVSLRVDREKDDTEFKIPESQLRFLSEADREGLKKYFQRPKGVVSALLIDDLGHVLTSNYNVAGKIRSVEVIFASGAKAPAKIVSRNSVDDIALLKLETKPPNASDFPAPFAGSRKTTTKPDASFWPSGARRIRTDRRLLSA